MKNYKAVQPTIASLTETIEQVKGFLDTYPDSTNRAFWTAQLKNCEDRLPMVKASEIRERTEKFHKRIEFKHPDGVAGWFDWAKKQYIIHPADAGGIIRVQSVIRKWEEEKTGDFTEQIDALEKVEQLVEWIREGRERGFGNCVEDLQKDVA